MSFVLKRAKEQRSAFARNLGNYAVLFMTGTVVYIDYSLDEKIRRQLRLALFLRKTLEKLDKQLGV